MDCVHPEDPARAGLSAQDGVAECSALQEVLSREEGRSRRNRDMRLSMPVPSAASTQARRAQAPAPYGAAPHCPLCGSADSEPWAQGWDAEYRTSDDRFTFHLCAQCGVLHIDPVPSDRLAQIYPPNYYAFATNK